MLGVKQHQKNVKNKSTNVFYTLSSSLKVKHKNIQLIGRKLLSLGLEGSKIKKALFINVQNPGKEISSGKLLNLENGINVDPI